MSAQPSNDMDRIHPEEELLWRNEIDYQEEENWRERTTMTSAIKGIELFCGLWACPKGEDSNTWWYTCVCNRQGEKAHFASGHLAQTTLFLLGYKQSSGTDKTLQKGTKPVPTLISFLLLSSFIVCIQLRWWLWMAVYPLLQQLRIVLVREQK